jgi:hypothetical protein
VVGENKIKKEERVDGEEEVVGVKKRKVLVCRENYKGMWV